MRTAVALGIPAWLVVAVMLGAFPATATASTRAQRPLGTASQAEPASLMTLSRAPAALRAAVRGTVASGGVLQKAELTASDGAVNDFFGISVAVSGSTAVVGAYAKSAAYVFVRTGATWSQQAELLASDGTSSDLFGVSVAISGSTAVIGATHKNSAAGAAYVFVRSGKIWSQQAELTASDGAANDYFGSSVAISGSSVVVGAYGKQAAYVFVRSGTIWSQQARLTASDGAAGDLFGLSVSLSGSIVVVGAYGKHSTTGAAYVYVRSGTTWSQQAELAASDGIVGDSFGHSVAISGGIAVIGADGKDSNTGAAYVFTQSGVTWSQQAQLTRGGRAAGDSFGRSVAISGGTVLVGAYGVSLNTGTADVFVQSGITWIQESEPVAIDGASNDYFGLSVAISGSTTVVGAEGNNSFTGAAYVYALPTQQAKLTAADAIAGNAFGSASAVSGSTAIVGAYALNSHTGAAYVFTRSGTTWIQQAKLKAADGSTGDEFGTSVAVYGSIAVVGASGKNSHAGAAYIFGRSGTTWSQQAELTASGGVTRDFGSSVAISGSTALVGALGSTGVGAAFVYVQSGTTWSQQAELTASGGAPNDLFGQSVAISGSTAVVGASNESGAVGAAYVFARSGTIWTQQAELSPRDGASGDYFGGSVAISGSTVVVGASSKNSSAGAVYVFMRSGTTWVASQELFAFDGSALDYFGMSVAVSGATVLVGAPRKNSFIGAAYMFARTSTGWFLQAELTPPDGSGVQQFGDSAAISASTGVGGAPGSTSATGAAYVFVLP